jgi:hypothetical protein
MTDRDLANLRHIAERQAAMERDGVWPTEDDAEMFATAFDAVTCLQLLDRLADLDKSEDKAIDAYWESDATNASLSVQLDIERDRADAWKAAAEALERIYLDHAPVPNGECVAALVAARGLEP